MDNVTVAQLMKGLDWLESLFLQQSIDIDRDGGKDYKVLCHLAFLQQSIDIDGDGGKGYPNKVPCYPAIYYSKYLSPSILVNLVIQLISVVIFVALESEWTFGDAFYHYIVMATMVVYVTPWCHHRDTVVAISIPGKK